MNCTEAKHLHTTIKEADTIFLKIDFIIANQLKTLIKTGTDREKTSKANDFKVETSLKNSSAFKPLSSFPIHNLFRIPGEERAKTG